MKMNDWEMCRNETETKKDRSYERMAVELKLSSRKNDTQRPELTSAGPRCSRYAIFKSQMYSDEKHKFSALFRPLFDLKTLTPVKHPSVYYSPTNVTRRQSSDSITASFKIIFIPDLLRVP
jgi:hypothetical protein